MDLLREMVELFIVVIRQAVMRKDPEELERAAHSLNGFLLNFEAKQVADIAQALKTMGRNRDLTQVQNVLAELEKKVDVLRDELLAITA